MNIEVIDNFLPEEDFAHLSDAFLGQNITWWWNPYITHKECVTEDPTDFQFTHTIFDTNKGRVSNLSDNVINVFTDRLKMYVIIRIKANLNPHTSVVEPREYHTDFLGDISKESFTSIFYVNTNNGYTIFEDGTKVDSVANRCVTFPGYLNHTGTSCSDKKARIVLNFNYFKYV